VQVQGAPLTPTESRIPIVMKDLVDDQTSLLYPNVDTEKHTRVIRCGRQCSSPEIALPVAVATSTLWSPILEAALSFSPWTSSLPARFISLSAPGDCCLRWTSDASSLRFPRSECSSPSPRARAAASSSAFLRASRLRSNSRICPSNRRSFSCLLILGLAVASFSHLRLGRFSDLVSGRLTASSMHLSRSWEGFSRAC